MKSKSHSLPACICGFALVCVLSHFFCSPSFAKNVTLGWDPNDEPDLEGYVVYRNVGLPGPPYEYSDDLPEEGLANPLNPMVTITGLQEKTKYYVAVTAYDTDGNESGFSNAVCVQLIDSAISVCSSSTSSSGGGGGGGGGGGCFISSAGAQTAKSLSEPLSPLNPAEFFLALLFLLLTPTAISILSQIINHKTA